MKNCEAAESIEKGYITNSNPFFAVNSSVTYECTSANHAIMYGDQKRICQSDMKWSGVAPTCQEIICPYLPRPSNCDLVQNGSSLNSLAEYRCHYGYKFKDVVTSVVRRRCTKNSTWDHSEPFCQRTN